MLVGELLHERRWLGGGRIKRHDHDRLIVDESGIVGLTRGSDIDLLIGRVMQRSEIFTSDSRLEFLMLGAHGERERERRVVAGERVTNRGGVGGCGGYEGERVTNRVGVPVLFLSRTHGRTKNSRYSLSARFVLFRLSRPESTPSSFSHSFIHLLARWLLSTEDGSSGACGCSGA